jgi:PKD repeat protein
MMYRRWFAVGFVALVPLIGASCATSGSTGTGSNLLPHAVISATPLSGAAPLAVTFDSSGSYDSNGSVVQRLWNFGDGSAVVDDESQTVGGHTVPHTFAAAGDYTVSLLVTDNEGGTDVATVVIHAT